MRKLLEIKKELKTYISLKLKNSVVKLVPQASVLFNLLFNGGLSGFHSFHHLKQAVVVVVVAAAG